jgi:hypothetical protein
MRAWKVWGLDVWGNEEDGYDVNDRYDHGIICIIDEPTDEEILKAVDLDYRNPSKFDIDGDDGYLHIERVRDGRPLLQLEREDDDEADEECERDRNPLRRVIQGDPVDFDEFTEGFLEAALWASHYWNPNNENDDRSLQDVGWTPDNLPEEIRRQAKKECEEFQRQEAADITEYQDTTGRSDEYVGHDTFLSSEHHGTGLWDQGAGDVGDRLTEKSQKHFGSWDEYLNSELPDPPNP